MTTKPSGDVGGAAATTDSSNNITPPPPPAAATAAPDTVAVQGAGGLYAPYLLEYMERDGSQTVGLGLPMWILVLAFVLLSGEHTGRLARRRQSLTAEQCLTTVFYLPQAL
jgi:hypothetical protein